MEFLIALIFVVAVYAGLILYGTFSWGFVSYKFYSWFILSVFPIAPQFTILHFIGFSLFLYTIMPRHIDVIKKEFKEKNAFLTTMIIPWAVLVIGWFIHIFI